MSNNRVFNKYKPLISIDEPAEVVRAFNEAVTYITTTSQLSAYV